MRCIKIAIYIIYLFVYGYSARMTTLKPDEKVWGYICALVFGILAIMSVTDYMKKSRNSDDKPENN